MGHYASYEVVADGVEPDSYGRIANILGEISGYTFTVWDGVIQSEDSYKWYGHTQDLAELSERYLDVTFQLRVIGEDGDRWVVNARNGKAYTEIVTPVWPDVDESKL